MQEILDNAIQRIQNGEEKSTVISSYPAEVQSELQAMLQILALIKSLPVKTVPTPNHRKLYLEHSPVSRWRLIANSFKLIPTAAAAFILVFAGTAFGANASLPGDKLFAVKKSYESLQIKLATNPEKRAKLQLEIAAQRFAEAQEVLAQPNNGNDQAKIQALEELNQQTVVALNDIKQSAVSLSEKNPGIVAKAEEITKGQSNLVAKADPKIANSNVIQKSEENSVTLHDIKKIIAAANEETGATIVPEQKITADGTIASIKEASVKIGNNEFEVNSDTKITNKDGNSIKLSALNIGDTVKIEAAIQSSKNIALSINIINEVKQEKEKETPKQTEKPKAKIIEKPILKSLPIELAPINLEPEMVVPPDPKDTFGGFIAEPPVAYPGVQK